MQAIQLYKDSKHAQENWTFTHFFLLPKGSASENSSAFWNASEVVTMPGGLSASIM